MEMKTVLIIDDNAADCAMVRQFLERDTSQEYRFVEEATVAGGLQRLWGENLDCVFVDDEPPDCPALDFLKMIKDASGRVPVPVVILTSTGNQSAAVALMREGAHDYLVKGDVEAEALRLAMSTAMFKVRTQRQLEQHRREVDRLFTEAKERNEELLAAKDAAEHASAVKDQFLAMVSHELRTPLTPVLSLVSSTLDEPSLTPDLRETFTLIRRNIELEARLIDDLLDLTRVMGGNLEIQRGTVDLHRCLQAAIDLCQEAFDAKRVGLGTQLGATAVSVSGDFARLQQVFWNVLKNAMQFTPAGGRVDLRTRNEEGNVVVEIRDNGAGIAAERLAEIFDAFNQPPGAPRFGSIGLGLTISRSIVEAHEGSLSVQSGGPDHGTVFTIRLPELRASTAGGSPFESKTSPARGKTILIIEDHEDTRRVLARSLRRRGFGVTAATSVASACEQFAQQTPDLVICDIGLPDGTGWDAITRLRERGPVRAIAVSGYGMEQDLQRSMAAGFAAHITKPVDFARLEKVIAGLLEKEPV